MVKQVAVNRIVARAPVVSNIESPVLTMPIHPQRLHFVQTHDRRLPRIQNPDAGTRLQRRCLSTRHYLQLWSIVAMALALHIVAPTPGPKYWRTCRGTRLMMVSAYDQME